MTLTNAKVIIPAMAEAGAQLLAAAFRRVGMQAEVTPPSDARTLEIGARHTCGDECFPAKVTMGDFMKVLERGGTSAATMVLFMPSADGPCRFGQYRPQLRRVLDDSGYGHIGILTPDCGDGYASLGRLAAPFFRTAWRAAVAADLLDKLLLATRPYEVRQGETDEVYRDAIETLQEAIETAPLHPGAQLRAIRRALAACHERFRRIEVNRAPKPLVGVVGEIFCRLNSFANQDIVRRVEAFGAEVWIAGFTEWVWYSNTEELRLLKLNGAALSRRALRAHLRNYFQRHDEHALRRAIWADFLRRPDPDIMEILNAARPYLPPEGAFGEMVLNVGNVPCFARRGVDGVIDISPFTCMNGIVSEALYPRISRDFGGFPIRSLYFDGTIADSDLDLELGVFVEMARAYRRKRGL